MEGLISIRQIMDDIMNHPLLRDVTLERVANYAYDFMKIVGCPKLFFDKEETVHIQDYRALLPCDFLKVNQVKGVHGEEFRSTTNSFFSKDKGCRAGEHTYKIQGSVIFASDKDIDIVVSYKGIEVDGDGFPMIPDNPSFKKALELYVKQEAFTILFDMGKISFNVLDNVQKEYSWYVGQAQTSLINLSVDEMESFTRMWNTLIPRTKEHRNGFKTLGNEEFINKH